jgi:predicted transcriptional regulator
LRPEHPLEELLNHYTHIRVFKTLATSTKPLTAYMLAKEAGLVRAKVARIIKVFESHGWVVKTPYMPASYTLNMGKQEVKKLVELMAETGYLSYDKQK